MSEEGDRLGFMQRSSKQQSQVKKICSAHPYILIDRLESTEIG